MAWQDEMIPILRVLANDLSDTAPQYSDDTMEKILLVAAKQVAAELEFSQPFQISITNGTLLPDPTATLTQDDAYVNLVTIKAACVIDRGEARTQVKQALYVVDGKSSVDLRSIPLAKIRLLEKGWCAVYDAEKYDYHSKLLSGSVGTVILTPFRLYAQGLGTYTSALTDSNRGLTVPP